jgi:RNA recognition motif-containing protein
MNIYVGNISREIVSQDLQDLFETFGEVMSSKVITDMYSGESRGFGFVEMASKQEAEAAISELDGKEVKGRTIKVNEARPRGEQKGGKGRNNRRRY